MSGVMTIASRTGLQRLEHRHGRAHALDAGDVAGGRDDAALAAADDHRLVGQLRIVALLDRRIEGVAVDMGESSLRVRDGEQPRAAAGRQRPIAGCCTVRQSRQKPWVKLLTAVPISENIKRTTQMVLQPPGAGNRTD